MVEISELKKGEIFSNFEDRQLAEMAAIVERKTYRKRAHVYEQGDEATHLFLVFKGLVSLRDIDPGDLVGISYEICEPGQVFGIASLMKLGRHSLTAVCLEDSEIVAVEAGALLELCRRNAESGLDLMLTIARLYYERYQHAKRQLREMVKAPTLITALPG